MIKESFLTKVQEGIFIESVENPDSTLYNLAFISKLDDSIDIERFIHALRELVKSTPALSTRMFRDPSGRIIQRFDDSRLIDVGVFRMSNEEYEEKRKNIVTGFNIEGGELCRLNVYITPAANYYLFEVHHIILDGTSHIFFRKKLAAAYNGEPIPSEGLDAFDISELEQKQLASEEFKKAEEYYTALLDGVETDCLPEGDVYSDVPSQSRDFIDFEIDQNRFKSFIKECGVSPTGFFTAAAGILFAKYNYSNESVIATVFNGRNDRNRDSITMLVHTLPYVTDFNEKIKVSDFLKKQQEQLVLSRKNCIFPFLEAVARFGVKSDIMFGYQGKLMDFYVMDGCDCTAELIVGENSIETSPLVILICEKGDGRYCIELRYRTDRFSREYTHALADAYIATVKGLLTEEYVDEICLADEKSKNIQAEINKTEKEYYPEKTVVELFREQAGKTPDNTCVVFGEKRYTYSEVDRITDSLALELIKAGVKKESVVGILLPRSELMPISAIGVLKSGGAYMPLDPTYPVERLRLMMEDSGACALIVTPELDAKVTADIDVPKINGESIFSLPECTEELPVPHKNDLAVLLYTSGSTGTPKGVMWEHGNISVLINWSVNYFGITESSKVAGYASCGFDANIYETYPALISGAAFCVIPEEMRLDLTLLREYFNSEGITDATLTTQVGRQLALLGGFRTLRNLTVAGEKLTPIEPPENLTVYNVYGPTEGSCATSAFKIDRYYKNVPIGRALDNLKLHIVDKSGKLLPVGAAGELWISGPHVTRGYLNRPEKTAEAYGDNPFCNEEGYERVYRTGDVVRLLSDGNMQFIGRRDAQVKIRGFRIELTEVEEIVRRFPGVKDATVAAFDEKSGGKFIAAYVVGDEKLSTEEIADFIRAEKPSYMVPAVIMQIDRIPLNQNQKVNKKALPVPERKFENTVKPQNEAQQAVFDIVAEVVGHTAFGINTNIYDAGLTSIGAVRLNVMLAEKFGIPVKTADIKKNDTVENLERFIASSAPQKSFEIMDDYPITQIQNGIFVECMASPGSTVYNIPVLFRLGDKVDVKKLEQAARQTVNAHPYVKTTLFTDSEGNIRAGRNDGAEPIVSVIKVPALPEKSELLRPFELLGSALYRMEIYETDSGNYLYSDFHHIICDGTSEAIILSDIDLAYAGKDPVQESFSGFEAALEEQELLASESRETSLEYWKSLLSGCETECLPKKEPECENGGAGSLRIAGDTDAGRILAFCEKNGITPNAFFNSVFSFVLSKFINKDSVSYSTIFSGRNDSRLARSVTMLVRTVPVTANFSDSDEIIPFIKKMQEQLVNSLSNDACSFAELSSAYGVTADIIFAYQGSDFSFSSLCGEKAELVTLASDRAKAPISLNVYLVDGRFEYDAEYRRDEYGADFAGALIDALDCAAAAFTEKALIREVEMLSEKAKTKYALLNDSDLVTEKTLVPGFIRRSALAAPDSPAVTSNGKTLTYGELETLSNRIANALIENGVKRDSIVGIVLERSCEIPLCQFAILKSGGAFLPVLPSYPDDRIDYCLSNADSPCVITTKEIFEQKGELFSQDKPYKTLILEELLQNPDESFPAVEIIPEQLAYCIYTSGSTGKPKGVMLEHRNFTNMVQAHFSKLNYYKNNMTGAALASCSVSFDASVLEIFPPLCSGKHLIMSTDEEFHNPAAMQKLMTEHNVQMMVSTPSYVNNLISMPGIEEALKGLRSIEVGAEVFSSALYSGLRAIAPELQIINGYGPTECSVASTCKELNSPERITIGSSLGNFKHYVLDRFGNILPPYGVGELIICGEGVGRGYVKLPEKNAESFFTMNGLRAYHSGDIVRLNANGELDFSGRKDNQVKLRGFRVELDEIEKVMNAYESVRQCKVIVRNNGTEDYLAGFFTADKQVDISDLNAHLKASLTYYMVPAVLVQLEQMPLTPNGKIDKNAFPETQKTTASRSSRKAPKKSLEQRLCEIFSSVLGIEEVFADDSFFELGGTSLSAAKVTMMLMSENIEVKYGDIFDNPTPEELAEFIEKRDSAAEAAAVPAESAEDKSITREALKYNTVSCAAEVKREKLGNVLLTGAVGFLGIHILKELLTIEDGHIYCLVRKGSYESPEVRLKTMLVYYFSSGFEDELKNRITVIDADITDSSLATALSDVEFDTVINCAACVKHFVDDDILDRINVHGVENLIGICKSRNARLVQISTVSVPGIHTKESYEKQVKMHENELFVIDDMDNKYGISKYQAELRMFDAIENGLRGKVVRVGNLMGRHSDGEFQVNLETNMFLSGIRGFALMEKYPISHMTDPMRFSPVDCTARAVVLLAGTNDKFTAFNADNRYGFDEMKIIDACNRNGITIVPTDDDIYYDEFRKKLGDDRVNSKLNGLAAYDIKDAHAVDTDNLFTTNILYRIGFSWPLVDDSYLDRAINSIMTLDYFGIDDSQ